MEKCGGIRTYVWQNPSALFLLNNTAVLLSFIKTKKKKKIIIIDIY